MRNLTIENIVKAVGGTYAGPKVLLDREISGVTLDSRKVTEGSLFVPVKGERVDGNDFIDSSFEKGAMVCFLESTGEKFSEISEKCENSGMPYIAVDSCLTAIRDLAEFYRKQFTIPVIGITGSVGKTSTKEMVAGVLSQKFKVLKTQGNFNNEIGLPLTIFELKEEHEIAVVEMGMSDFGEMERLSKIARPDVCIITNIGPCHLENCGDLDGVLRAKSEIFKYKNPDGAVFLNGDDEKLATLSKMNPVFFGLTEKNAFYAGNLVSRGLKGYQADIHMKDEVVSVHVPTPGIHMVSNAVAAAAIGKYFDLTNEQIANGIAAFQPVGNRSNLIETEKYLIFSDCYNANPASMRASINVMKEALGRKVCLLGDMFELGVNERALHKEIGAYAVEAGMDLLLLIGDLAKEIYAGAISAGAFESQVIHFENSDEAKEKLPAYLKQGDTILVKASHGMHFEEMVAFLETLS